MQFLSETLDGKLVVCDDGFVIEHWTTLKEGNEQVRNSTAKNMRVDMIFDEDGIFQYSEIKE